VVIGGARAVFDDGYRDLTGIVPRMAQLLFG
jgi:hypothetical protein